VTQIVSGKLDFATARRDLKKLAGSLGEEEIANDGRATLILNTMVEMTRGWGQYVQSITPSALAAFPAQELVRVRDRVDKREWLIRFARAGGTVAEGKPPVGLALTNSGQAGRAIAAKMSPVWEALSRFGNPWPPYDFNSGVGIRGVSRAEALKLGVDLSANEAAISGPPPVLDFVKSFNRGLRADAPDVGFLQMLLPAAHLQVAQAVAEDGTVQQVIEPSDQ
jgi:hypothetical protein